MGLTIHYELKIRKSEDAASILEAARKFAETLHPAELSEVKYFTEGEIESAYRDTDSEWRWAVIQSSEYVKVGYNGSVGVNPVKGYMLRMWPGEGCEEANFGFMTYPGNIEYNGARYRVNRPGQRWSSFCKTTYADNFVACHLMVIAMLDWFDDHGVDVTVSDEGEYWKGRDIAALANTHTSDRQMLAAYAGAFKDAFGENMTSPILNDPNFEHLEYEGNKHISTAKVLELVRQMGMGPE